MTMDKNLDSEKLSTESEDLQDISNNTTDNLSNATDSSMSTETNSEHLGNDVKNISKNELVEALKNLLMQQEVPTRLEVDNVRNAYYAMRKTEVESEQAAFDEKAEENSTFTPSVDPSDEVVKEYLSKIKERRAKKAAEEEKVKENNYKLKKEVITTIQALIESNEEFNVRFKEFKDLQNKWSSIGTVPQTKNKELSTDYQIHVEKFYDLVKINNELRDYDFKKNLENKTALIEATKKLIDEADTISAFHQLQNFHDQWKEIGPVEKELREPLWQEFKDISTQINKNYQSHFEGLKEKEEENLTAKQAIIDCLKAIDYSKLTNFKEWDKKTEEVIAQQEQWRKIGFVPRKFNTKIFEEFRGLCDKFFETKSEFFKGIKSNMDENLELKKQLVEKAKALKESTDWNKTTQDLIKIQKEWKTIGPVPRKHSDAIWKEFVEACDHFFDQKKKVFSSNKEEEVTNYKAKTEIVEEIKKLDETLASKELLDQIKELQDKWHQIGHVPFKDKDRSYKELYAAVDAHYDRLKINKSERLFEEFKSNVQGRVANNEANAERILSKEKDNLIYQYNKVKADLQTYETNMNFLTISSKGKENPLLKNVNQKVEALQQELEFIEKKIKALESNISNLD